MSIKPGSIVDNQILNKDLNAIYASGWFSGVKIKSQDGPLGVRLIVIVIKINKSFFYSIRFQKIVYSSVDFTISFN